MHPQHEPTGRQTQSTVTAGQNVSNLEDSLLSNEASKLSAAVASSYRRLEPQIQNKQQSILVPARKKHTNEELLPSGYRFSLPSPRVSPSATEVTAAIYEPILSKHFVDREGHGFFGTHS